MALNYVNITGTFDDGTGNPLNGTVTFTPSQTVYAAGIPVVSTANPIVALVINGALKNPAGGTLQLLATDNTGLTFESLTGFFYWNVNDAVGGRSWSFFLNHTPATQDLYTLANTAASGGFTNPMTTLGDLIYETATPAAARLAGPTGNAPVYALTDAPAAGVAQTPAWLPANALMPWQFAPEAYGAKGNGRVLSDVVTNATTTITSASANFTAADVGKYIMIHGANGATSGPLITTIASFTNSTTVVLAAAAGASVSNCPTVYGTDDTTAINSAVTAAGNYATTFSATSPGSGGYFAEVVFGAKIYILGTGPTQVGNGTSTPTFNTQIPIPYPNANGTTQKLVIALTGAGDSGHTQFWGSTTPNLQGTCLVSMLTTGNSGNATFGFQSVVGGPTGSAGYSADSGLIGIANVKVSAKGISIWLPILTNIRAWDFGYVSQASWVKCAAHIFAPTGVNGGIQPYLNQLLTNATFLANSGVGFLAPVLGNNASVTADNCVVQGYECGWRIFDHFVAPYIQAIYCDVAVNVDRGGGLSHLIAAHVDAEAYNGGLQHNGNFPGSISHVDIWWSCENASVTYDVSDPANSLLGEFHFQDSGDTGRGITVSGAGNLHIINDEIGPGHMVTVAGVSSPPAVPASTSTATLVYRDAWVSIHTASGVTVSAITIDGTATGLTVAASSSVAVRVPSGKTIALTYAGGTPTWDWWLD